MRNDTNIKIHMIPPDGKLRIVPSSLKDDLMKKGWRVVVNPKENYYPQFDVVNKKNLPTPNEEFINDVTEPSNVLGVEVI